MRFPISDEGLHLTALCTFKRPLIKVLGPTSSPSGQTHTRTHTLACLWKTLSLMALRQHCWGQWRCTVLSVVTRFHPYSHLARRSSLLCVSGCSHGDCVFNISGVGQVVPGYGGAYPQQYYPGNSMVSPALQFYSFIFLISL